ncbi:NusB antitermination factor, partial [gut metagenome]
MKKTVVSVHKEEELSKAKDYAEQLLQGIIAKLKEVDSHIDKFAIDWTVDRMPATTEI